MEGYGQWAQTYRDNLWTGVLPLPPRAKTPPPGGYTGRKADKIPDDAQIAQWVEQHPGGNLCLRMPTDVLGIDVDDYEYEYQGRDPETKEPLHYPDGRPLMLRGIKTGGAVLAALEEQLGQLPPTWRSSSRGDGPSGIRFFRVPAGLLWGDFGQHLEAIWWGHRYAVVWPSVNPDSGMRYLWINDAEDDPMWGSPPPKVTDLPELPASWVAHHARPQDAPRLPAPVAAARPGTAVAVADHDRPHQFTREQAARYVETEGLEPLRSATHGTINNRLNDAAVVMSHFVPTFFSPAAAHALLLDAAMTAGYDHRHSAERTIASGLATVSWTAELVSEPVRPPGGARTRPRDHEDDPWPTEAPDDPLPPEAVGFWERRPELGLINQYARSKYVAPWAVLGAVLARVIAAIEPNIQLPPTIGDAASLNLFVALVGRSGGGKDAAAGVAKRLLDVRFGRDPLLTDTVPLGSGEGMCHIYMKPPPKLTARRRKGQPDEDSEAIGLAAGPDEPIQYRTRALVTIAEIDTLGALGQRQGSTLGGQLRQAWSGQQLGFYYATSEKRLLVPEHAYRMCIVAGVQPGRAGALLSETDGGTPQRFLWLPAMDPTIVRDAPPTPAPLEWMPPVFSGGTAYIKECQTAVDMVIDAAVDRSNENADALDGHALLTRLKVAAALAALHGTTPQRQCEITEEDWELSGVLMAVSDHTRASVQQHLAQAAREENRKKAVADGLRQVTTQETIDDALMRRALKHLRDRIGDDWVTNADMRKGAKSDIKKYLNDAVERLVAAGEMEVGTYTASGQTGRQMRRPGRNSE